MTPSIFVLVPAYNAASTIEDVVSRIPAELAARVVVVDDGSSDRTYEVAREIPGVTAIRHEQNKGYGGAQATLYRTALEQHADIMVMVHSDGGHRPEELPVVLAPILDGDADVSIGSRMVGILGDVPIGLSRRAFRKGREGPMPLHIFSANLILSKVQNLCFRTNYASFHDGYRACTAEIVSKVSFDELGSGWLYDSEFLLAAHEIGATIQQVPVSTHYEPGASAWKRNLMYGLQILRHALAYRFRRR